MICQEAFQSREMFLFKCMRKTFWNMENHSFESCRRLAWERSYIVSKSRYDFEISIHHLREFLSFRYFIYIYEFIIG